MSEHADWLAARKPSPPERLSRALGVSALVGEGRDGDAQHWLSLAEHGSGRLVEAMERPGRDRAAAFTLLTADALFTYACEAALESADPEAALLDVLAAAAR